jgi:hypothetical protein
MFLNLLITFSCYQWPDWILPWNRVCSEGQNGQNVVESDWVHRLDLGFNEIESCM